MTNKKKIKLLNKMIKENEMRVLAAQQEIKKEEEKIDIPPPPPEEKIKDTEKKKGGFDLFMTIGGIIAVIIIIAGSIIGAVKIVTLSWGLEKEQVMTALIYTMSIGWFLLLPIIPIITIARKEIFNKLKVFGRKSRVIVLRLILGDSNEYERVFKLTGNTMEIDDGKYIINPRKATMKDGVKILTYVGDNAIAHDYFQDPNATLKSIGKKINETKSENLHDVFSDPIRIDAKYFNETFLAAQQTNPDILKKIIAFLTSKNVLVMLGVIALLAGAAAVLSMQANNLLNSITLCQTGTIVT